MSDTIQLQILSECSWAAFLLLIFFLMGERWYRIYNFRSACFTNTNASSNLARKLRGILTAGDAIWVPSGEGDYPLSLRPRRRRKWEELLKNRLKAGIQMTYIITSPNSEALDYWQRLVGRMDGELGVCILNRQLAPADEATEIACLDEFHPVLVLRGDEPLAMWIENEHPPRSAVAYNVQYVAKEDITGDERERFDRYYKVLARLIDPTTSPPFLRELTPHSEGFEPFPMHSARAASNSEAARLH
jgi:hypothetical protein